MRDEITLEPIYEVSGQRGTGRLLIRFNRKSIKQEGGRAQAVYWTGTIRKRKRLHR